LWQDFLIFPFNSLKRRVGLTFLYPGQREVFVVWCFIPMLAWVFDLTSTR
jgi:hypothetical protein